ncbi:MAG: AAA family ATPase [Anaerolineae bacterium]|nr:AAA family ATPase [Anaerolineae bacterium]
MAADLASGISNVLPEWMEKEYRGARWVRVDLHLHSPGACSFKFPAGLSAQDKEQVAQAYVAQLKAQGIEIAAITDYQQIRSEWFQLIQEKALAEGIYVYPGVELSFGSDVGGKYGLHVLAIFPLNNMKVEDINRLIDKLLDDRATEPLVSPKDGHHRDLRPGESLIECLIRLRRETKCLLIFPHPNDDKGLFKSFQPARAAEILAAVCPDAVEEFTSAYRGRLQSTNKISVARIARVRSSDNRSIDEIGTKRLSDGSPRATYLKLSALDDLRAIRLALRDHEILTHVGDKPKPAYTYIEAVEIDGSGFLGSLRLAFSPELNVLIGGRGVGKSALLEVIRYGLDLTSYASTEYRKDLPRHALGSGGKVTLYLRQIIDSGVERRFRIERVLGEKTRVYELDERGDRSVDLPVREIMGDQGVPLFFGQREIYEVTQSAPLRRRLLDELIGKTAYRKIQETLRLREELRRNMRRLLEIREQRLRREEAERRLREIEHELHLFERYGIADKLREETALTRDEERLKHLEAVRQELADEWQEIQTRWKDRLQRALSDLAQAESQQKPLLQDEAAHIVRDLLAGFDELFRQGTQKLQETERGIADVRRRWNEGRQALSEDLRRIRQELGAQTLDPDRLIHLTREQAKLAQELQVLQQVETEAQSLEMERNHLLQRLRDSRREAFKLRASQAEAITREIGARVRVEVIHRGQRKEYAERLVEFFSGSRIPRRDLEALAYNQDLADGLALAEVARRGKEELKEKTGLSDAQSQRLLDFLNQEEGRWYELELIAPDDEVRVSLKVNERWINLEDLSPGQRATAMLLILLTQTQRPLLIDQPEDDLDNRFVYEDIVRLLRAQKGRFQLVGATHNANIPVLAHAELVVALEARSDRAHVAAQGGMDHRRIQEEVRQVMEGGEEAFRRRAEKYGLEV